MSGTCGRPRRPSLAPCDIRADIRNRTGKPRWWCHIHGCPAWGPDGERLDECAGANTETADPADVLVIDPSSYPGGVGIWGSVEPIYNTGPVPTDRGVHVHARRRVGGPKVIDRTFREVTVRTGDFECVIDGDAAAALVVANVFGLPIKSLRCVHCGELHVDLDQFSSEPHRRHQCNQCGRFFFDPDGARAVSNPCVELQRLANHRPIEPLPSARIGSFNQADFSGMAIWGSNPAILWTSSNAEETGIHLHAWARNGDQVVDDTFSELTIDGVTLDDEQVRTLMVQRSLPDLESRVAALICPSCSASHFDRGMDALRPTAEHQCSQCGAKLRHTGRVRKVVSNPTLLTIAQLARNYEVLGNRHAA